MSFINERLLEKVAYGFHGGPTWSTTRVRLLSGRRKFNAERSQYLLRLTAPFQNIKEIHHDIVLAQYNACLGPIHSFRFKNPNDYQLNDVVIGTAVGGAGETMQIVKPYSFAGTTLNKDITKPVDSTVYTNAVPLSVTEDDVPLAFTVDYLTGILTFTSTVGKVIRVTGEFDVPVYFDDDALDVAFSTHGALNTEIVLMEALGE